METTIKVSSKTARRIQKAKYSMGYKTADQTINAMLDIIGKMWEAGE